jgi:hypothetical protein
MSDESDSAKLDQSILNLSSPASRQLGVLQFARALSVRPHAGPEMALISAQDKADHSEERTLLKAQPDAQRQAAAKPDAQQEAAAVVRHAQQVAVAAGHAQQAEVAAEPDAQQREAVVRHAQQVAVVAGHAQ